MFYSLFGNNPLYLKGLNSTLQQCSITIFNHYKSLIQRSNKGKSANKMEDEESEGLALLIPDIQETARLVRLATQRLKEINGKLLILVKKLDFMDISSTT